MAVNKTSVKDIEKNFAKFDLALICEDKYKNLKHIDMVIYTMLKNQEGLSINSVKNGNMRYVDKNGFVFVSISQDKLCKVVRTTKPTLLASFERLVKCELLEIVTVGQNKCNKMYIGNADTTTTLGEYINKIGIELDEEAEEIKPNINVTNINDARTVESTGKNNNSSNNSIPQKGKKDTKQNIPNLPKVKTRFHNINQTFNKYEPDELEKILQESQKDKFPPSNIQENEVIQENPNEMVWEYGNN